MAIKRAAPGASATGNKKARAKTPAAKGKAAATSKGKRPAKLADSDNESASASDPDDDGPDAVWGADVQELEQRTIEQTYQKKSQLEHILLRPDTYIGSVEPITQTLWVYDSALNGLQYREATVVPGLYKIYDEILVNAADNKIRDPSMNTIKVTIDAANNVISIMNNGKGIPVEIHKDEKMYVPELIFGHLLTSSNYDDDQKKVTGGRNGYGAKLCNIFSKEFIVETADKVSGRKFKQVFRDNMSQRGDPVITANTRKEEFTKITFRPDLAKFHMEAMDDDIIALFKKRVYDMAGTMVGVNVYLNGEKIRIKNFQEYVMMYLTAPEAPKPGSKAAKAAAGAKANGGTSSAKSEPGDETDAGGDTEATEAPSSTAAASEEGPIKPTPTIIHEVVNSRWEVVFAVSEGQFQQVSFVNGICTSKGGTHVNHVADQITTRLAEVLKKKHKAQIKPFQIKSQMWLFINCLIENPSFDSQTKENMTLRPSAFGSKCEPSEKFYKKVIKSDIVENVLSYAKFKLDQQLKKTDGTSRQRLIGIDKLDDATKAGTRESQKCTLVLTEGDSARSLALSGFEVVGKEYYGVYPLRGKVLNVRCAKASQILDNKELSNIKRILGLKHGTTEDASKLRYGHLMIMTDQDHDGSHIKGLIINFLDFYYPNLLRTPGFLLEFVTPIVRATKGKDKKDFFTIPEYETWCKTLGGQVRSWHSKYFKGLGTSDASDAK
ncbi:DNA topoisomerase 2, partial [Tieghemiomyces parasiticus]